MKKFCLSLLITFNTAHTIDPSKTSLGSNFLIRAIPVFVAGSSCVILPSSLFAIIAGTIETYSKYKLHIKDCETLFHQSHHATKQAFDTAAANGAMTLPCFTMNYYFFIKYVSLGLFSGVSVLNPCKIFWSRRNTNIKPLKTDTFGLGTFCAILLLGLLPSASYIPRYAINDINNI